MSGRFTAGNKVAIVGYAQSPVRRYASRSLGALTVDTVREAIADAGLQVGQVDGYVTASLFANSDRVVVEDGVSIVSANWLAMHLGANPRYVSGFEGVGQLVGSVALGVNAVATRAADYVVVYRALHNPRGRHHQDSPLAAGPRQWTVPQGFGGSLAMIALPTTEYLQRYGADREALAAVVVEARKNGARIPWSCWHGRPLTTEQYLEEPLRFDPISRFDCDMPIDGVAAFVLTSAERARDHPHRPVYVAGYASGAPVENRVLFHWALDEIESIGAETGRRLWESAGVGAAEVDLPQVYDGFSPFVWYWLEALGFCERGEAHRFVADAGIDSDRPGALPALSGGGSLGNGRMHGVPQMLECYLQLSRRAGDRQRERAEIGVACHAAPHYGGAVVYATERY